MNDKAVRETIRKLLVSLTPTIYSNADRALVDIEELAQRITNEVGRPVVVMWAPNAWGEMVLRGYAIPSADGESLMKRPQWKRLISILATLQAARFNEDFPNDPKALGDFDVQAWETVRLRLQRKGYKESPEDWWLFQDTFHANVRELWALSKNAEQEENTKKAEPPRFTDLEDAQLRDRLLSNADEE